MKGDYLPDQRPALASTMYSMPPGLWACRRASPVQLPGHLSRCAMFAPAIVCGNAFILKTGPSVIHSVAVDAAEPAGKDSRASAPRRHHSGSVTATKEAGLTRILPHLSIQVPSALSASTPIANTSMGTGCANGKRFSVPLAGAQDHMIIMPDADLDQAARCV